MELYLFILFILLLTAISDLAVGVANDAVNFLNSALGSRVAPRHIILLVASLGVLVGATFSSGMMEVARKGIFKPEFFTMHEVMFIFLAVMLTDIILLDFYNTFGLPTSTTVSLVFAILGGSFGMGLIKQMNVGGSIQAALNYIDTTNVLTIILSIALSIVFAFVFGVIVQFLTRLLFTFNYEKTLKRYGALYSAIALTFITFFIIVKGAKGSSVISPDQAHWITDNLADILLASFVGWWFLWQLVTTFTKINVLKVIVLVGTFALALAFAANDLVNFIGAPLAALSAYQLAAPFNDPFGMTMEGLRESVRANPLILLGAGAVMVTTLWMSKKARTVSKTEMALGRQDEGVERFESSPLSRTIVRMSIGISEFLQRITPSSLKAVIARRIDPSQYKPSVGPDGEAPMFDLPRAAVNLIVSAALISFGTSFKLPLSTTFVTFMVAMSTSLADRAWGRESAVYRVNGVITVIGGWFFTAFMAFMTSFIFVSLLHFGGIAAIIGLVAFGIFAFVRTNVIHRKREDDFTRREQPTLSGSTYDGLRQNMNALADLVTSIDGTIQANSEALIKNKRKQLREIRDNSLGLVKDAEKLSQELFLLMKNSSEEELETSSRFARKIAALQIITANLQSLTTNSYNHIDNNHPEPDKDQADELREAGKKVQSILVAAARMFRESSFSDVEWLSSEVQELKDLIHKFDRNQIKRIKAGKSGTRHSLLFIGTLSKAERIAEQFSILARLYEQTVVEKEQATLT